MILPRLRWPIIVLGTLLIVVGSAPLAAQITFTAGVERVTDGDTLTLRVGEVTYRARLNGIDAPERNQPYGREATAELQQLVVGRSVLVEVPDVDRYGRLIVKLFVDGRSVNEELVRRGAAWQYVEFDRSAQLAAAEAAARAARAGLWALENPVPPWEWRRR